MNTRQPRQKFVCDIFTQAGLTKPLAFDPECLCAFGRPQHASVLSQRIGFEPIELEGRHRRLVDLAQVVVKASDLEPAAIGVNHPPPVEVVQCGPPEHRLFATRIHRDIAANAGGFSRGGVDRKDETGGVGRIRDPFGDHTSGRKNRVYRGFDARQLHRLNGAERL